MSKIKVHLVDEDGDRRTAIGRLLLDAGVHAEPFESPAELMSQAVESAVVLLHDDGAPIQPVVEDLTRAGLVSALICFSEQPAVATVVRAIHEGASDYLAWPFTVEELAASVNRAAERAASDRSTTLRRLNAQSRLGNLTSRERQVLAGVVDGQTNREIAERLCISYRTVEIHRANLLRKMNVQSSAEAVRLAVIAGS